MRRFILAAVVCLASGCALVRDGQIRQQAAFDFACPEERVAVLRFGPLMQSVEVDVCGMKRLYHRFDAGDAVTWVVQPQETARVK